MPRSVHRSRSGSDEGDGPSPHELARIARALAAIRLNCVIVAVFCALFLLVDGLRVVVQGMPEGGLAWVAVGGKALVLAVAVLAVQGVPRAPVLWTASLACAVTALFVPIGLLALALVLTGFQTSLVHLVTVTLALLFGVSALGLWIALFSSALAAHELFVAYPGLRGTLGTTRTLGDAEGEVGRRDRRRRALSQASTVRQVVLVTLALVGGLLVFFALDLLFFRPPTLEERAAALVVAWNSGDWPAVEGLMSEAGRAKLGSALERALHDRDWREEPPTLTVRRTEAGSRGGTVVFSADGEDLTTKWRCSDDQWFVRAFELPWPADLPDLAPFRERFVAAWHANDLAGVVALMPEARRARNERRIRAALEERGWADALPRLGLGEETESRPGRATWMFPVDTWIVTTRWRIGGGTWLLSSLAVE